MEGEACGGPSGLEPCALFDQKLGFKCVLTPILTRRPENVANRSGDRVYSACEAYGEPTPHISFRKMPVARQSTEDPFEKMSANRLIVAVQTRGGPVKHRVSAWLLVDPLSDDDAGWYECLASNNQGSFSGKGSLEVVH